LAPNESRWRSCLSCSGSSRELARSAFGIKGRPVSLAPLRVPNRWRSWGMMLPSGRTISSRRCGRPPRPYVVSSLAVFVRLATRVVPLPCQTVRESCNVAPGAPGVSQLLALFGASNSSLEISFSRDSLIGPLSPLSSFAASRTRRSTADLGARKVREELDGPAGTGVPARTSSCPPFLPGADVLTGLFDTYDRPSCLGSRGGLLPELSAYGFGGCRSGNIAVCHRLRSPTCGVRC